MRRDGEGKEKEMRREEGKEKGRRREGEDSLIDR